MWFHLLVLTIVSRAAHYSQHQKNRHIICLVTPKRNVIFQNEMRKKSRKKNLTASFLLLIFYKTRIILQESCLFSSDDVRLQILY